MSENLENEPDSPIAQNVRTGIKVVAYPASIYSGYVAAVSIIRNEIYKNVAVTGQFEAAKKRMKLDPLREAMRDPKHPMHAHLPELLEKLNEDFRVTVNNKFREMGLKNVGNYWKGLNRNQKIEAATLGMTVSGIVLGAMLTVANSKGLLEFLTNVKRDKDGQTPAK